MLFLLAFFFTVSKCIDPNNTKGRVNKERRMVLNERSSKGCTFSLSLLSSKILGLFIFSYSSLVFPPKKKLFSTLFSCFQGEGDAAIGTAAAPEEEEEELTATSGTGPPFCPPLMLLPLSTGAGCDARKGAVAGAERGGGSVAGTGRGAVVDGTLEPDSGPTGESWISSWE